MSGASNITICGPIGSATRVATAARARGPTKGSGSRRRQPDERGHRIRPYGNGELDLEILVNQGYANTGGTTVMGPVLADTATMGGNGGSVVPSAPPSGFPSVNVTAGDMGGQARILGADAVTDRS